MTIAYIALGANMNNPKLQIQEAIERLHRLPHTENLRASSLYETAPMGLSEAAPNFINAVVSLSTTLEAHALLDALLAIETAFGRTRETGRVLSRTLDLDLLLFGETPIHTPRLTVPHPRMHLRAFVLAPLLEIAPDCVIPQYGAVATLLAGLETQPIRRIP